MEPGVPPMSDGQELRTELTNACNALGRELSRLAEHAQWADIIISKAESTGSRGDDCGKRLGRACPQQVPFAQLTQVTPDIRQHDPEQYYIGDGLIAQLLADAEAVI